MWTDVRMESDDMVEMNTIYDALKMLDDCDVWDAHYDDCIAWCLCDDDDDLCSKCATELAKRIELVKINRTQYGIELVADIGKFVKEHMNFMHEFSQGFKWPMPDADPENDESVFRGVQIINAMQAGYTCDEDYNAMLKELGCE